MPGYNDIHGRITSIEGGRRAVEEYTNRRIVEGLDGADIWDRAKEARFSARISGKEVPADLTAAADVIAAQGDYIGARQRQGLTEDQATREAETARESLVRQHLASNGGDMTAACVSVAADLRRRATASSTARAHESRGRRTTVHESMTATRAGAATILMKCIDAGQGSSGYYAPEVLERAAKERVFPKGTHVRVDHETYGEASERPEGTLDRLAGYLTEDAYFRDGALYATASINSRWRHLVDDMSDVIGTSISAAAERTDDGTIVRLLPDLMNRVDLVTYAGRGGGIL